jgi:hypothetical protein
MFFFPFFDLINRKAVLFAQDKSIYGFNSRIDQESFITKANNLPEIVDFFGLFDFLYKIMYVLLFTVWQLFISLFLVYIWYIVLEFLVSKYHINFCRLFPLEDQLRYSTNEEHAGWLEKDKGESLANAAVQFFSSRDRRWFVARYGFLAYFKVWYIINFTLTYLFIRRFSWLDQLYSIIFWLFFTILGSRS